MQNTLTGKYGGVSALNVITLRIRKAITGIVGVLVLLALLILLNIVQLLSLLVRPFSQDIFRKINHDLADFWWGLCADALRKMQGLQVIISGDDIPKEENAIVLANHQKMADIAALFFLAKPKNRLGDLKWFAKNELKYVPGLGWGLQFLDCIFVRRNWYADKSLVESAFQKFHTHKIPIWLMIFPEGTRRTPLKQKASQEFSRDRGWPELHYVLVPRTKGFSAAAHGLRHHVKAVYDVTIGYVGSPPGLWQLISGQVEKIHLHVRRYKLEDIADKDEETSQWLLSRYFEKDELLERFFFTGHFQS
jgi:1-acyl-sn-glycerol-3-phosphate acyltransferase